MVVVVETFGESGGGRRSWEVVQVLVVVAVCSGGEND